LNIPILSSELRNAKIKLSNVDLQQYENNSEKLKEFLKNNGFVRTFAIIDETGEVDIDNLFGDIIEQVDKKGKIEISIPMFGKFKFTTKDFENLYQTIKGE
jgi:uncharacterized protein with ATP-grasp and redox domains